MSVTWICLLALAGSALSVPIRQSPETLCLSEENFVRVEAEGSCIKYFQCYSGNAYLMQCPDYTWFNPLEQTCDDGAPPEGCEVEGPPAPLPVGPPEPEEEPEVEPQEPEEETQEPEEEPQEPEEEPQEAEEEPQQPEEEPQEPDEELQKPEEDPQEPEGEPQVPEEELNDNQELETGIVDPETEQESEEGHKEPENEPQEDEEQPHRPETDTEDPEEELDSTDHPDLPIDELELPIEELSPHEIEIEGSGDPIIGGIEEGSGFGFEDLKKYIPIKLRKANSQILTEETLFSGLESSGDLSRENFDYELDDLFIPHLVKDDVTNEIPTIDPTFVLPDPDKVF